jgi:hypothetical protein
MTASTTEQERAEFEAWYIAGARKAVPAFAEWSEIEIREGCMRPDSGSYRIDSARIAWDAWQAARRAPAVPVPQGLLEAAQRAHDWMDSQADSQSKGNFHSFDLLCLRQERDALAEALAAAPQPPEAAHVELPEPAIPGSQGVCCGNFTTGGYYMGQHEQVCCGCPDDAHPPYYSEQQVRDLLAAARVERKPLTDEAIRTLYGESDGHWQMVGPQVLCFARSIESVHGIQEQST